MLILLEEICITLGAAVNSFARLLNLREETKKKFRTAKRSIPSILDPKHSEQPSDVTKN